MVLRYICTSALTPIEAENVLAFSKFKEFPDDCFYVPKMIFLC